VHQAYKVDSTVLNWLEKYIVYVNLFTNPISAFSELF